MNFRNFTLLLLFSLTLNVVFGQKKVANLNPEKVVRTTYTSSLNAQSRFMEGDTIFSPILADTCSDRLLYFKTVEGYGFIGGMNDFGDLEKAQRMIASQGNFTVTNIITSFGVGKIVGDGELAAKIYEVDEMTNGPGALAGTSDPIKVSDINLDPSIALPTGFTFSTPVAVIGQEFFVSIDFSALYTSQDTVSLLLTDVDCGFAEDAWELFDDGTTWVSMSNLEESWGLLSNFSMIATLQLDEVSSTKELLGTDGRIRLRAAFPNPAQSSITIAYDLEMKSTVQLEIYSLDGKMIQQLNQGNQPTGQYQVVIPIEQLSEGMYLYGIVTEKGRLMNKFTIAR